MFCHNCGIEVKEGMVFCPGCGEVVAVMQNGESGVQNPMPEAQMEDEDKTVILTEDIVAQVIDDVVVEEKSFSKESTDEEPITEEIKGFDNMPEEDEQNVQEKQSTAEVIPTGIIATEKIKYCPNCGTVNAENDVFCYSCGFSFADDKMGKEAEKGKKNKKEKVKKEKNKKQKKGGFLKIIAALLVICLLAGCAYIGLQMFGGTKTSPIFYLSGNKISAATSAKKIYAVGEDAYADKDDIPDAYRLWMDIVLTKDHKYVFFPQEVSGSEYDLYRVPYGKKDAEAVKVAKNVVSYTVLSNNTFIYLNGDGKLYRSNMKEDEKIDSDVSTYQVSEDKKQIFWMTADDGDIYVQDVKLAKEKKKVASEIDYIMTYTEDLSQILVMEEDEVVLYTDLDDETTICDSDVIKDYWVDGSNIEIYFYEYADDVMSFSSVVSDPDAVDDANMKEPVLSDYQTTVTKESFWGPRESVETDDTYYTDLEKYQKKLERDQYRQYIQGQYSLGEVKITYFSTEDMDFVDVYEGPILDYEPDNGSLFLMEIDTERMEAVSLAELMELDYSEVDEKMNDMLRTGMVLSVYQGGKRTELECDMEEFDVHSFYSNGNKSYVGLQEIGESDVTLYEVDTDGSLEVLCEEFYTVYRCTDEGILYGAELDAEDSEIELYWNDDNIDSEVYTGGVGMLEDGSILYRTDVDDNGAGTLHIYNGKSQKVSDDVITYQCLEDGRIAYLYDYSFKKYKGDLKVWSKNKSKLIESDVKALLSYVIQK